MFFYSALFVFLPFVFAYPLRHRAATTLCGQYETVDSGPYTLLTDVWGEADASSGSQCSVLQSVRDNTVEWYTKWSWNGDDQVKSFANIQLNAGINQQLDAINTMPSTWKWSQEYTGSVVSDATYDLFTSYTSGGSKVNEIMVWLGNSDAKPISYEYSYDGEALAIENNLNIAGHVWDLYRGSNNYNVVYTFVPVNGNIKSFSGDIYSFLTHLIGGEYIQSSEYLVVAQAGTEATSGSASFKTSSYSLSIN